jgi:ABC-type proline/glycine betaine transport system ATPase subunit
LADSCEKTQKSLLKDLKEVPTTIQLKSHDIAKTLQKAMKAAILVEAKVSSKSAAKLKKLETKIDKMVKKIPANEKRAGKALKNYKAVKPVVEGLVAKRPECLEKIEMAMKVLNYAGSTDWAGVAQTTAEISAEITADNILD